MKAACPGNHGTSLVAQMVKRLSAMQETRVRFLGREDPLEKEMAIHSSNIALKIPWTEEQNVVHWQNVVHRRRERQTTSVFLPWEPHEQYEKAKW